MGYQEVFIRGVTNKDTKRIYEAMQRLGIRAQNDLFSCLQGMATVKKNIQNLKEGTKLILITGERMRSSAAYLNASNKDYTNLEKLSIACAKMYPLDELLFQDGVQLEYKDYFEDTLIKNAEVQKIDESKMQKMLEQFKKMQQVELEAEEVEEMDL